MKTRSSSQLTARGTWDALGACRRARQSRSSNGSDPHGHAVNPDRGNRLADRAARLGGQPVRPVRRAVGVGAVSASRARNCTGRPERPPAAAVSSRLKPGALRVDAADLHQARAGSSPCPGWPSLVSVLRPAAAVCRAPDTAARWPARWSRPSRLRPVRDSRRGLNHLHPAPTFMADDRTKPARPGRQAGLRSPRPRPGTPVRRDAHPPPGQRADGELRQGAGPESADARRTVVLAAVVCGAVALKPVFMWCRRGYWGRVSPGFWGEKGGGGRLTRRDLLGVRIGWKEKERGREVGET